MNCPNCGTPVETNDVVAAQTEEVTVEVLRTHAIERRLASLGG